MQSYNIQKEVKTAIFVLKMIRYFVYHMIVAIEKPFDFFHEYTNLASFGQGNT